MSELNLSQEQELRSEDVPAAEDEVNAVDDTSVEADPVAETSANDVGADSAGTALALHKQELALAKANEHVSYLQESLSAMQAACRHFLNRNQRTERGFGWPYEAQLHSTLGEMRALFGLHIARLACAYDLGLESPLADIIPPEALEDHKEDK